MLDVANENTTVSLPDKYWQFQRAGSMKQPFSSVWFLPFLYKIKASAWDHLFSLHGQKEGEGGRASVASSEFSHVKLSCLLFVYTHTHTPYNLPVWCLTAKFNPGFPDAVILVVVIPFASSGSCPFPTCIRFIKQLVHVDRLFSPPTCNQCLNWLKYLCLLELFFLY